MDTKSMRQLLPGKAQPHLLLLLWRKKASLDWDGQLSAQAEALLHQKLSSQSSLSGLNTHRDWTTQRTKTHQPGSRAVKIWTLERLITLANRGFSRPLPAEGRGTLLWRQQCPCLTRDEQGFERGATAASLGGGCSSRLLQCWVLGPGSLSSVSHSFTPTLTGWTIHTPLMMPSTPNDPQRQPQETSGVQKVCDSTASSGLKTCPRRPKKTKKAPADLSS